MKSLLLVIDLQNIFINEHTQNLPDKIKELIDSNVYNNVAFTRFINFEDSIFVKKLGWRGCISDRDKQIVINTKNYQVFDKSIYSALTNELKDYIKENKITEIYLCGIDTESCVLKTAYDLFEKEYNVYILKDYCACTRGVERHLNALEILKRNIGKNYVI